MGLFDRPPPDPRRSFAGIVSRALAARGVSCQPLGDVIRIDAPHPGVLSLANVWQLCLHAPPKQWEAIIARFLDTVLPGLEPPPDEDLEAVRPSLRVRLAPDDAGTGPALLARPLADGIRAVLAVDRPTMVELVPSVRAARWELPPGDLFALGLENVRGAEPRPVGATCDAGGGILVRRFSSDSYYTTTWVHWLGDLTGPLPPAGALVGLPARHELYAYPIAGLAAMDAVHPMAGLVATAYQRGPGALSPDLYWWRAGVLRRLPLAARSGTVRFFPPDEFLDAVSGAA